MVCNIEHYIFTFPLTKMRMKHLHKYRKTLQFCKIIPQKRFLHSLRSVEMTLVYHTGEEGIGGSRRVGQEISVFPAQSRTTQHLGSGAWR